MVGFQDGKDKGDTSTEDQPPPAAPRERKPIVIGGKTPSWVFWMFVKSVGRVLADVATQAMEGEK